MVADAEMVDDTPARSATAGASPFSLDSVMDPAVLVAPVYGANGTIVDFVYVDANAAACEYNRTPHAELIGASMIALLPPAAHDALFHQYVDAYIGSTPLQRDGVSIVVELHGVPREFVLDVRATRIGDVLSIIWRDDTERTMLYRAVADSETRYRLLADNSRDIVFEMDLHGNIVWISPSVTSVSGYTPEELVGRNVDVLISPVDLPVALELRERIRAGESPAVAEMRMHDAVGEHRWTSVHAHSVHDDTGATTTLVVGVRDIHAEMLARRAVTTLTAANGALVRATDEAALLHAMCVAAVEHGHYIYAWYCRPVDGDEGLVELCAEAGERGGLVLVDGVRWREDDVRSEGSTGTALRTGRTTNLDDIDPDRLRSWWNDLRNQVGFRSALSLPVFVDGAMDGVLTVYDSEPHAFDERATAVLEELTAQLGIGIGRLRNVAALATALADQDLLTAAIEQSAEAIVITDPSAAIMYANPAAARSTGYTVEELVGQNPRLLQSGLHSPEFYRSMWARLVGGSSFHGTLVNRRKNGEVYEEDATITPVHSASGELLAYVGVKRELLQEDRLTAKMDQDHDDREVLLDIMRHVRAADTLAGTAKILCSAVARFDGIDGGTLIQFNDRGVIPFGMTEEHPDVPIQLEQEVPVLDVGYFVERSQAGAWWIDLDDPTGPASLFPALSDPMRAAGFHATAYAPIRWEGELVAALSVVTSSPVARDWLPARLSTLEEFAGFASLLLGEQAVHYNATKHERALITEIIREQRFHPVFQPIVDLQSGRVRGYEALTRFDDGVQPDHRFNRAHDLGLGVELERACVEAALAAAAVLPADMFLSLNFSPAALIDGTVATVVRQADRPLVVELTEQFAVESYPAARRAIRDCRPAKISVDDAGAGFASLRHIVELEPDMVKLDIALVRDIDLDPARQALAAGLCHFAQRSGTLLVAEGVERESEANTLRELGIELAQGFRFGHPAPL